MDEKQSKVVSRETQLREMESKITELNEILSNLGAENEKIKADSEAELKVLISRHMDEKSKTETEFEEQKKADQARISHLEDESKERLDECTHLKFECDKMRDELESAQQLISSQKEANDVLKSENEQLRLDLHHEQKQSQVVK